MQQTQVSHHAPAALHRAATGKCQPRKPPVVFKSKGRGREEICSAGGGGVTRRPISPTPPPSLAAVTGGGVQGRGGRPAVRGAGVNPTSVAQNDTHVALIILTTQMWGGGDYWWKKLFRVKICVPAPSAPTSLLTQNKGPDTEPRFSNPPPPSFSGRPCHPPPLLRRASMSPPTHPSFGGRPCHPPPSFGGRPCHPPPPPSAGVHVTPPPSFGGRPCHPPPLLRRESMSPPPPSFGGSPCHPPPSFGGHPCHPPPPLLRRESMSPPPPPPSAGVHVTPLGGPGVVNGGSEGAWGCERGE